MRKHIKIPLPSVRDAHSSILHSMIVSSLGVVSRLDNPSKVWVWVLTTTYVELLMVTPLHASTPIAMGWGLPCDAMSTKHNLQLSQV